MIFSSLCTPNSCSPNLIGALSPNATAIKHPHLSLGECYFDCTPCAHRQLARRCYCCVHRRFARRCLCRAWPSRAPAACPSLPLLQVAIASATICQSLHSLRWPSTFLASPLPHLPAICLSLPLLCMAITSMAVCLSLPLPRVAIASAAICPYSPTPSQLLARHCPCRARHQFACRRTRRTRRQRSLVTSCRPHSCSHCQLRNLFLADCCIASCCAAASRPLLLSIWTSPPSNPFTWHAGHIVIWPRTSGVTIAALGQPARCTLSVNLFVSHRLFAKMNAQGLVQWPPGNGERGTRQ